MQRPLALEQRNAKLRRKIQAWGRRWRLSGLERRIHVEWSARLRRSLGRAYPERHTVRLSTRLVRATDAALTETLCHEAAHVAVAELFPNRTCRAHGPEWAELVRAVGFEPRARRQRRPRHSTAV